MQAPLPYRSFSLDEASAVLRLGSSYLEQLYGRGVMPMHHARGVYRIDSRALQSFAQEYEIPVEAQLFRPLEYGTAGAYVSGTPLYLLFVQRVVALCVAVLMVFTSYHASQGTLLHRSIAAFLEGTQRTHDGFVVLLESQLATVSAGVADVQSEMAAVRTKTVLPFTYTNPVPEPAVWSLSREEMGKNTVNTYIKSYPKIAPDPSRSFRDINFSFPIASISTLPNRITKEYDRGIRAVGAASLMTGIYARDITINAPKVILTANNTIAGGLIHITDMIMSSYRSALFAFVSLPKPLSIRTLYTFDSIGGKTIDIAIRAPHAIQYVYQETVSLPGLYGPVISKHMVRYQVAFGTLLHNVASKTVAGSYAFAVRTTVNTSEALAKQQMLKEIALRVQEGREGVRAVFAHTYKSSNLSSAFQVGDQYSLQRSALLGAAYAAVHASSFHTQQFLKAFAADIANQIGSI